MSNREKTTFRKHVHWGDELRTFRAKLFDLALILSERYGKSSKEATFAKQAYRAVDKLRCRLDERVFMEHPTENDLGDVYLGDPKVHAATTRAPDTVGEPRMVQLPPRRKLRRAPSGD